MSNLDFAVVLLGPLAGVVAGLVVYLIAMREHRRAYAELNSDGHLRKTPAE